MHKDGLFFSLFLVFCCQNILRFKQSIFFTHLRLSLAAKDMVRYGQPIPWLQRDKQQYPQHTQTFLLKCYQMNYGRSLFNNFFIIQYQENECDCSTRSVSIAL